MNLHQCVQCLSRTTRLQPASPASPERLLAIEERVGLRLPDDLRDFFLRHDGMTMPELNLDLLGTSDIIEILGRQEEYGLDPDLKVLPVVADNESNFALMAMSLMPGRIVWLPHDADTSILCTGLARLFELISEKVNDGETDGTLLLHELSDDRGDYAAGRPRTSDDAEAAQRLFQLAESRHSGNDWARDYLDPISYGLWLLPDSATEQMRHWLFQPDPIRREAHQRLSAINSPTSRSILQDFQSQVDDLESAVVTRMKELGATVTRDDVFTTFTFPGSEGEATHRIDDFFPAASSPEVFEAVLTGLSDEAHGHDGAWDAYRRAMGR